MRYIPIKLEQDYATLKAWWVGHDSLPIPESILPDGWFAEDGGELFAASFLYLDRGGKIAVIEWTTTNPEKSFSRKIVDAVKGLYAHLEWAAGELGCTAVISFVAPNTSEERIMTRLGFICTPDSKMHRMYAKPVGGKVTCP